jgi:hypothetical protein
MPECATIAQAVKEKLEKDELDHVLDEVFGDRPMTEEERAWAYGLLLRKSISRSGIEPA